MTLRLDVSEPLYLAIPADQWDGGRASGRVNTPYQMTNSMRVAEYDAANHSGPAVVVKLCSESVVASYGNPTGRHRDHRHRDGEFSLFFIVHELENLLRCVVGWYEHHPYDDGQPEYC